MAKEIFVSVVSTGFNAGKYFEEAITSILNQTYKNYEYILIDNGSSDDSWKIIQKYAKKDKRIIPIQNKKTLTIAESFNVGFKRCTGKYIVRQDADDWAFPERIEKQIELMKKDPEIVLCGGAIIVCDENLSSTYTRRYPETDKEIREKLFFYNPFAASATIMKKDAFEKIGFYDEHVDAAEDYDSYFRLAKVGKIANVPEVIIKYRVANTGTSISKQNRQELQCILIRLRAITRYDFEINAAQKLTLVLHLFLSFFMPNKMKLWVFNTYRKLESIIFLKK